MQQRLVAILAADVVGYARMMAEDQKPTLDALRAIITCPNDGTARFTPFVREFTHGSEWWDFEFDDCQDDAIVLDGQVRCEFSFSSGRNGVGVMSSELSIDGQSRLLRYSGNVGVTRTCCDIRPVTTDVNYSVTDGSSTFELSNSSTSFSNYTIAITLDKLWAAANVFI